MYPYFQSLTVFSNILQSVTQRLSLGGEVFWAGQHRKSGIGYAGRYETDKMVIANRISPILTDFISFSSIADSRWNRWLWGFDFVVFLYFSFRIKRCCDSSSLIVRICIFILFPFFKKNWFIWTRLLKLWGWICKFSHNTYYLCFTCVWLGHISLMIAGCHWASC